MSTPAVQSGGVVVVYLLSKDTVNISAGDTISIQIENISGDAGGTRITQVELGYRQMEYTGEPPVPLSGTRNTVMTVGNVPFGQEEQEDWQDLNLPNNWAVYNNTYNPPSYFKDSCGVIHLRGVIKNPKAVSASNKNQNVAVLDEGYRPQYRELFSVATQPSGATGRVDVTANGIIAVIVGNNTWVSLDGLTFRAYSS